MRYYIGFILSILGIALILFFKYPEFSTISKAKESFNLADYKTAAKNYKKLNLLKAKYNEGVANYKDGNFSQALQNFKNVKDDNLSFEILHNLGNTYANLHDFNKSILSFKKALEIKDDNDTRFNLELVEKIKDQNNQNSDNNKEQNQDKNQNNNQNSDKNKEQNSQNNSEQNSQNSKDENEQNKNQQNSEKNEQQNDKQNDNKSNENQEDKNNQETEQSNENKEDKNNQENEQNNDKQENKQNENNNIAQKSIENEQKKDQQKEDENKENQNVGKQVENKKDDKIDEISADIKPISDMEEAKWQKALEHRNIGTFLMPIGQKNHKSEDKNVKPW